MNQEQVILKSLIQNEEYTRKVLPFVKSEYFKNTPERVIFNEIKKFIDRYNKIPSFEAIDLEIDVQEKLSEETVKQSHKIIDELKKNQERNEFEWLVDTTEKFCKDQALYNAISESIEIMDTAKTGKKKNAKPTGAIPQILTEALGVCFDSHVGHDYVEESDKRYEYYHNHKKEKRVPFDLELFNEITRGGLPPKTLNIFLAGVGVGKTLTMCHVAGACLNAGYDVLYITLEMAEEEIAMRIDANLLNTSLEDLEKLPKDMYSAKIDKLKKNVTGKLIIKEYPSTGASTIHFRALLHELQLKKSFKPQIVFVDYINICASSRISMGQNGVNSYGYIKSIAEELRGLAQEFKLPLVTATQLTRSGFGSSDVEMTDTAESFGLPATADFMVALQTNEEFERTDQVLVKQLKNRYNTKKKNKRFIIGMDTNKMRLYDAEQAAQKMIINDQHTPKPGLKRTNNNAAYKCIKVT